MHCTPKPKFIKSHTRDARICWINETAFTSTKLTWTDVLGQWRHGRWNIKTILRKEAYYFDRHSLPIYYIYGILGTKPEASSCACSSGLLVAAGSGCALRYEPSADTRSRDESVHSEVTQSSGVWEPNCGNRVKFHVGEEQRCFRRKQ